MNYNESMTELADAVRAKAGVSGKLTVDEMTAVVQTIQTGGGGVDTGDATATADDILGGRTAYVREGKVTGTIAESRITSDKNTVRITSGYISSAKNVTVGNVMGTSEIIPSRQDFVIPENTYIENDFTVKGDGNLTGENIREGVSIFGVEGSFAGSGGGGGGGGGGDTGRQTILYMPMNGDLKVYGVMKNTFISPRQLDPWGEGSYPWDPTFDGGVFSGEQALSFRAAPRDDEGYPLEEPSYCYVDIPLSLMVAESDFTIDLWGRPSPLSGIADIFTVGRSVCVGIRSIGSSYQFNFENGFANGAFPDGLDQWYHMALVRSGNRIYGFVNGVKVGEKEAPESFSSSSYGEGGHTGRSEGEPVFRIAHLRVLNYALWTENFTPPEAGSYAQFKN